MKLEYKYILIIFTLVFSQLTTLTSVAQDNTKVQEKCLFHFSDLQRKQSWTDSYNAAGLHFIDFKNASFIEGYFGKNDGPFVNYYESENSFNYGLRTASYTKVNKVTFFGKIDYNNFLGQKMTNSGLIYPNRYLLTVADDRPSEKRKESYNLSGGVSAPITKDLRFGLQINYEAANLAKMRDLRHKTDLLDFEITGGLLYSVGSFNIGANYYYRKFHENVKFSKVADNELLYTGHVYKGLWFGLENTWSETGLNLTRSFLDKVNGASLQVEFAQDNFRFHNEFTYKYQDGSTGSDTEKKSARLVYSLSKSSIYEYKGIAQLEVDNLRHYLKVKTKYADEVSYDKITSSILIGGVTYLTEYGQNKAFSRRSFNLNATYELALGALKCNPDWNFSASYNYNSVAAISSLITPFYFTQDFKIQQAYGKVNKNFQLQKGMIDLSLLGGFGSGVGNKLNKNRAAGASEQISESIIPVQNKELLDREYEFLTAKRMFGEIGFRYSRFLDSNKRPGSLYLDAKYSYTNASDIKYHTGSNAGILSLAIGYSF